MRTNEDYEKEISQLNRALGEAAGRMASLEWSTFCAGPSAYQYKLSAHTPEYRRFAQSVFEEGFRSGYLLYSHDSPPLEEIGDLLQEFWSENDFNNLHGEYIGNPNSTLVADTVPELEAKELFRLGFQRALTLLVEIKTLNPFL